MIGSWGRRPNVGNRPRFRSSRKCMRRWLGLGRHLFLPEAGLVPPPSSPPSTAERPRGMWRSPQSSAPLPCSFARRALPPGGVNPRLPSRACKFSSALTAKAYGAAGQAASALHAMALLQVHQAKALKQLHEGDADPGVLQELRTSDGPRAKGDESHGAGPGSDDVHISGPGAPPVADLGGYEGVRQAPLPGLPDLPGRPIRRSGGGLCPTVLRRTEADGGVRHILPRRSAAVSTPPPAAAPRLLVAEGALLRPPPPLQLGHNSSLHNGRSMELAAGKRRGPPPPLPSLWSARVGGVPGTGDPEPRDPALQEMAIAPLLPPEEGRVENFCSVPPLAPGPKTS